MVDFARIQNRIYYGYTKAAIRLGTAHNVYRPLTLIDPLQTAYFLKSVLISVDQNLKYTSTRKYGDNLWQFLPVDGLTLQNYDYFTNSTSTYFISDIAPDDRLSPPLCVQCNTKIDIARPSNLPLTPGTNAYQQYQPASSTLIVKNCPVSFLQHGRMDASNMKLPTSVKLPYYAITMPDLNLNLKTDDVVTDTRGRRLSILSAERTKKGLGFRIIVVEQGT